MNDGKLWQIAAEGLANSNKISELDLHGLNVSEASPLLESFLNSKFMEKEEVVKIICGIGTGRLMKGMGEILEKYKEHGLVEDFVRVRGGGVYIVRIQV